MKFVLFCFEFVGFWDCDVEKSEVISPWINFGLKKTNQSIWSRDENLGGFEPRMSKNYEHTFLIIKSLKEVRNSVTKNPKF
jgi:hypothetical protein